MHAGRRRTLPDGTPPGRNLKRSSVDIVISNSSSKPIYEQIACQVKDLILSGELQEGQQLPSIRSLANDLRVSAITTKRAYADLEAQGFLESIQGKGCFVSGGNKELLREERIRRVESLLEEALEEARGIAIPTSELHEMLDLLAEER